MGEENVRTYCIVLLCSLVSRLCLCLDLRLMLVLSCVWMVWYGKFGDGNGNGMRVGRRMLTRKCLFVCYEAILLDLDNATQRKWILDPSRIDLNGPGSINDNEEKEDCNDPSTCAIHRSPGRTIDDSPLPCFATT
jgi:hypothetical protein